MERKAYHLNQDHRGVSRAVPFILLFLIIISSRVFYRILPFVFGGQSGDYLFISIIFALFGSALSLWFLDPVIKRLMPSGHVLTLDPTQKSLTYAVEEDVRQVLENQGEWQITRWYFRMGRFVKSGRERQVPNGWYCMGLYLKSEGDEIILFCYVQPRKQRRMTRLYSWDEISMFDTLDEKRNPGLPVMRPPTLEPSIPSRLLVGDNGHIWLAERKRREEGLEMAPKDFEQFLGYLAG